MQRRRPAPVATRRKTGDDHDFLATGNVFGAPRQLRHAASFCPRCPCSQSSPLITPTPILWNPVNSRFIRYNKQLQPTFFAFPSATDTLSSNIVLRKKWTDLSIRNQLSTPTTTFLIRDLLRSNTQPCLKKIQMKTFITLLYRRGRKEDENPSHSFIKNTVQKYL